MTIDYYWPRPTEEATAPDGVEVEVCDSLVELVLDVSYQAPAQSVHLTAREARALANALLEAARVAEGEQ